MTLYRHFASKDLLVAECLRQVAQQATPSWTAWRPPIRQSRAELTAWLAAMTDHIVRRRRPRCGPGECAVELAGEGSSRRR